MNGHTLEELHQYQAMPLKEKIEFTQMRIAQWYRYYDGDVYISYSGGKDSEVLLDIARKMYPHIDAVHIATGLEYPETTRHVMNHDNITIIRPKLSFREVICKYGYPLFSKETSECVWGARKYLTSLLQQKNDVDRQPPYKYWYDRVCGQGVYAKKESNDGDNGNRKLGEISEYDARGQRARQGRQFSSSGETSGNADNKERHSAEGEYP